MLIKRIFILLLIISVFGCSENRGLVVGKIQSASKLATTEFKVDKLVFGTKNKRVLWVIKLKEAQFLAKSQATITAGIDLTKLQARDIDISKKRIEIRLPHVEVINFSYPAESFERIDILSKNALTSKIRLDDEEKFFQEAELDIRNSLQFMNIVETTEKKTRTMVYAMLKNLGYDEIYIDFKKGDLIKEIDPDKS